MDSIRLRTDQIAKLRKVPGLGASIIATAIRRYERGEIVIRLLPNEQKGEDALQVFPLRKAPRYPDDHVRLILDAHFASPIDYSAAIAKLDDEIDAMLGRFTARRGK